MIRSAATESALVTLLQETTGQCEARCRETWRSLAGSDRPRLLLYGAGNLGRLIARDLQDTGWGVLGFADGDPAKWGTTFAGLPVLSPEEGINRCGADGCVVVTILQGIGSHRYPATRRRLEDLGARHIVHAGHLIWRLPERIRPYYFIDQPKVLCEARDAVLAGLELWGDDVSRDLYARHALWRLTLDFRLMPEPDAREEYFAPDLMPPRDGDVFLDGGAFDGDSTVRFLDLWGDCAKAVHAFEPDPGNIAGFRSRIAAHPARDRVHFLPRALSDREGELSFEAEGTFSSAVSAAGRTRVPCSALDDLFLDTPFTLLKLDVEGSEPEALRGGRRAIGKHRPRVAVCLYHRQAHLWEVPLLVDELLPDSRFSLVCHAVEGWDVVMYGVPR